jgi:predicted alpha/beta superfamily hydrolase
VGIPELDSSGPASVRESDTYRLRSRHVGAELEVRVARPLPPFMAQPAATHDVLYVLDGDLFFGLATDVTRLMYQLFGELPATLVVAVGYGAVDGRTFGEARNRDFTPTAPTSFPGAPAPPGAAAAPQNFGGADRFLAFLLEELRPLIAERYPAATGPSTLFGSSMGGLFASYVLLERPESFERYVIASPALWWDDHLLVRTAAERPLLRGHAPARVFFGAGALEEGTGIPFLDQFKLVSNLSDFAQRLRARAAPELDVSTHVFDGESHTSVVPAVLTRGLRAVQRPP